MSGGGGGGRRGGEGRAGRGGVPSSATCRSGWRCASSPASRSATGSRAVPGDRRAEVAQVNLPVAVLIWLMIIPMLLKIDFGALHRVKEHWRGIGVTLFVNWAVKPFSMALLGWLFIGWLFRP